MKIRTRVVSVVLLLVTAMVAAGSADATTHHPSRHSSDQSGTQHPSAKPTIVLVHGAFADSSSWSSEIPVLQKQGYPVIAVANPLRDVGSDAAYLESILQTITGPIVLVGHSYAGFLISQAAAENPNVKALVYVAAYIPIMGESPADLTYKDPGSLLTGTNLVTRTESTGTDIYINPATFGEVYAGGLSRNAVALAAVVQRPITASALSDKATLSPPASTPKWAIVALEDHAIPTKTEFFMATRAHANIVTTHSGHDVPAAQPLVVEDTILDAARTIH